MCGIIGFAGNTEAVPILLDGLERLEYRGYDSAGVAVASPEGRLLFWEYGTLRRIRYLPENEAALVRTIMMEHRYQKGWIPKKDRAPPSGPVR